MFNILFAALGLLALAFPLIVVVLVLSENLRHRLFRRRMRRARPSNVG